MSRYSTNEAAAKLGISGMALSRYVKTGKVPAPQIIETGKASLHAWTEEDIEHVRKLLPKIANGRKTRYQKKGVSTRQSTKTKKKKTKK